MGVPILTAEYHTQYIWLILLTKIYECSLFRHVTAPCAPDTVVCYLSSQLPSTGQTPPKAHVNDQNHVLPWPVHIGVEQTRPCLDAEVFSFFIALVSSASNPL